jgi:hypothetical protein
MSKEWDFYFARVNDDLASLFVDLGIRDSARDPLRTYLVWCWVYMNQARSDGLSSAGEAPILGTIEDDLVGSLKEQALFSVESRLRAAVSFISIQKTRRVASLRLSARWGGMQRTGLTWGANTTLHGLSILISFIHLPSNCNG